jgi:hypothetical protein
MAASVCQQTDDTLEDVDRSRPCTDPTHPRLDPRVCRNPWLLA